MSGPTKSKMNCMAHQPTPPPFPNPRSGPFVVFNFRPYFFGIHQWLVDKSFGQSSEFPRGDMLWGWGWGWLASHEATGFFHHLVAEKELGG